MELEAHGVKLTPKQQGAIRKAMKEGKDVSIKLSKNAMMGPHVMGFTSEQLDKMGKAHDSGKGLMIKMSAQQMASQGQLGEGLGDFLKKAGTAVVGVAKSAAKKVAPVAGAAIRTVGPSVVEKYVTTTTGSKDAGKMAKAGAKEIFKKEVMGFGISSVGEGCGKGIKSVGGCACGDGITSVGGGSSFDTKFKKAFRKISRVVEDDVDMDVPSFSEISPKLADVLRMRGSGQHGDGVLSSIGNWVSGAAKSAASGAKKLAVGYAVAVGAYLVAAGAVALFVNVAPKLAESAGSAVVSAIGDAIKSQFESRGSGLRAIGDGLRPIGEGITSVGGRQVKVGNASDASQVGGRKISMADLENLQNLASMAGGSIRRKKTGKRGKNDKLPLPPTHAPKLNSHGIDRKKDDEGLGKHKKSFIKTTSNLDPNKPTDFAYLKLLQHGLSVPEDYEEMPGQVGGGLRSAAKSSKMRGDGKQEDALMKYNNKEVDRSMVDMVNFGLSVGEAFDAE